jgi:O-antigen/teichoic acid export membrane protein
MMVRTAGKVAGFLVAATVAYVYRSYWALPIGIVSNKAVEVAASYLACPARPRWSLASRSELFGFSFWLLMQGAVNFVREKLAGVLVGRQLGTESLGVFSLGQELANMASSEIVAPLNRAVFTRHSQLAGNVEALKNSYLSAADIIWLIAMPATVGLALVARDAIAVVYGSQWGTMVPVLEVLCLGCAVGLVSANAGFVFLAANRGKQLALVSAVCAAGLILALLVLVREFGLIGAAWAQVVGSLITIPVMFVGLRTIIPVSAREILARLWRPTVGCAAMFAVVPQVSDFLALTMPGLSAVLRLLVCVVSGVLTYCSVIAALWVAAGRPESGESVAIGVLRTFVTSISAGRKG